jgi:hypothetical protein
MPTLLRWCAAGDDVIIGVSVMDTVDAAVFEQRLLAVSVTHLILCRATRPDLDTACLKFRIGDLKLTVGTSRSANEEVTILLAYRPVRRG